MHDAPHSKGHGFDVLYVCPLRAILSVYNPVEKHVYSFEKLKKNEAVLKTNETIIYKKRYGIERTLLLKGTTLINSLI